MKREKCIEGGKRISLDMYSELLPSHESFVFSRSQCCSGTYEDSACFDLKTNLYCSRDYAVMQLFKKNKILCCVFIPWKLIFFSEFFTTPVAGYHLLFIPQCSKNEGWSPQALGSLYNVIQSKWDLNYLKNLTRIQMQRWNLWLNKTYFFGQLPSVSSTALETL